MPSCSSSPSSSGHAGGSADFDRYDAIWRSRPTSEAATQFAGLGAEVPSSHRHSPRLQRPAAGHSTPGACKGHTMTQEQPRLRLGIIADPQYDDREPDLTLDRHFRMVPARLEQAVAHFDTLPLDAVIVLGDLRTSPRSSVSLSAAGIRASCCPATTIFSSRPIGCRTFMQSSACRHPITSTR